jgi:autotransporter-associated beta strand protein
LKKNQSAAGLVFANTSTTRLQGGTELGKNYTLTLGASGILVNSGAGNVTIGSTTLGNVSITLNAAQSWTNSATSTLTIVNNVTNGANLLTVAGTVNTTINGVIGSGSGGLAKDGAGTLTLSGTNTYTGVTTLTSGILSVATIGNGGVAGNLGKANNAASNLVFNGGTLQYNGVSATTDRSFTINTGKVGTLEVTANTLTLSGASALTNGALTKTGAGTLTLTGSNLHTGATTISAGKLALSGAGAIADTSAVNLATSGVIFDISAITASGETVGSLAGVSGSSVVLGAKKLTAGGDNTSTSFAGVLSGTGGSLTKTGTQTLTLSGVNTYTGGTTISGGKLSVAASSALGLEGNNLTIAADATLVTTGSFNTSRATTLNGSGGTGGTFEVGSGTTLQYTSSSIISGAGSLIKTGTGTLLLEGANTYTGGTYLNAGTTQIGNDAALGAAPTPGSADYALRMADGATLQILTSSTNTQRQLILNGSGSSGAGSTFEVTNGFTHVRSGLVSGTGKLNLTGTGTMVLSNANTYSGGTSITTGTLQVTNTNTNTSDSATGIGAVTVGSGGTLKGSATAGQGFITGTVGVNSGAELLATGGATLTLGGLTLNTGSLSTFQLGSDTSTSLVNITGNNLFSLAGASTIDIINTGSMAAGTYHLFDYTGTAFANLNNLVLADSHTGLYNLSLVHNTGSTSVDLDVTAITQQWKKGGSNTNWSDAGNWWVAGGGPDATGAEALFLNNNGVGFNSTETVTIDTSCTVGSVVFNNATTAFTIAASTDQTLTLDETGGGNAVIHVIAGSSAISAPVVLADNLHAVVAASASLTLSGAISGSGKSLEKSGTGTLTLSGSSANTYDGLTTVAEGTLTLSKTASVNAIGTGGLHIDIGATAALGASNQIEDEASVSVNGTFSIGAYAETIAGLVGQGEVTTSTSGVLTLASTANSTFLGVISGSGSLAKAGSGTLTLNGNNTYSGGTSINGGTLSVGSNANLGIATGGIAFGGGTLFFSGSFESARGIVLNSGGGTLDTDGSSVVLTGLISGASGNTLTKAGLGTVDIDHANTYSGATVINGGILRLSNAAALGDATVGTTVNAGGEIEIDGSGLTIAEPLTLHGGEVCNLANTNTYSAAITLTANSGIDADAGTLIITGVIGGGSYGLTKYGAGTVQLSNANTYTGATTVSEGTLAYGISGALMTGIVTVDGATAVLALDSNSDSVGIVTVANGGSITGSGGVLSSTGSFEMQHGSVSAILAGSSIALNKTTPDTVTLTGANTYTGATIVSGGKLTIGSSGTINDTSSVTIGTTNTLATAQFDYNSATALSKTVSFATDSTGGILSGTGTITNAVAVTSGNIQTAGTAVTASNPTATLGTETFTAGITYNEGSIFEWNLTGNTATENGTRRTDYDAVNTGALATTGTGAIFRVVLNGAQNFSETFWDTTRQWADIFTGVNGTGNWDIASIFTSMQYWNSAGDLLGPPTGQGSFSMTGTTLTWTAVPEPTSALAGLLLGAGLLRRRRK